jgi:hypothetical protein
MNVSSIISGSSSDNDIRVGVVVSWSSNEKMFIEAQMRELLACASFKRIVFSVGSHLYDGREETIEAIALAAGVHGETLVGGGRVSVVRYDVDNDEAARNPRKFHNLARSAGYDALANNDNDNFWVLFLDGDEIPSGRDFDGWLRANSTRLKPTMAYKFSCYWYFKEPTWRARRTEDSILLLVASAAAGCSSLDCRGDPRERGGIADRCCPGGCMRRITGADGQPMFHHFSWVRTLEQVLHKVSTWGHKEDRRDWQHVVRSLWDGGTVMDGSGRPLQKDPIHGYEYDVVDNLFSIHKM